MSKVNAPEDGLPPPPSTDPPHSHRSDLQDLVDLPRSALLSFAQKHMQPQVPRTRAEAARPSPYPKLAAFAPGNLWQWISEYWRYRIGRKHSFQTYDCDGDNGVYRMRGTDGEVRIALAGDWGTGTDEAAKVAAEIEAYRPHYAIHLGDVYYVGDPVEVGANFLGVVNPLHRYYKPCKWPQGSEGAFSLNGNHEMYARGYGYFDLILPKLGIRGSPRGQQASYFCLENDDWRIIAVDTGYNSIGLPILENFIQPNCALPAALIDWLRTVVQPRADDPRGVVILSHHQYYSRFDHCYPKPAQQLAEFFSRPVLWLWGHEHRLVIYREAAMDGGVTASGRCIGHGGMPVELPPATPLHDYATEFVDTRVYPNDENLNVGFNGFAQMTLRGNKLILDYVDLVGTQVFSEVWTVDRGALVRTTAQTG
jgi:hypothetical protein